MLVDTQNMTNNDAINDYKNRTNELKYATFTKIIQDYDLGASHDFLFPNFNGAITDDLSIYHQKLLNQLKWLAYSQIVQDSDFSDKYIIELFIKYCLHYNLPFTKYIEYLEHYIYIGFNSLLSNAEFAAFVRFMYDLRDSFYLSIFNLGVDMSKSNVFELNKGQIDTCANDFNQVISNYGSTFGNANSMLYKHNGKLYKLIKPKYTIDDDDQPITAEEIPEGSTFVIQNPYNIREILYALNTLAGTNNIVKICYSFLPNSKCENFFLGLDLEVLKKMSISSEYKEDTQCYNGGINYYAITINTLDLKQHKTIEEFMSENEKKMVEQAIKENAIDQSTSFGRK